MPENELTIDNLDSVFIRSSDGYGHWKNISVKECTDLQFAEWYALKTDSAVLEKAWSMEERLEFCNLLWKMNRLYIVPRGSVQ